MPNPRNRLPWQATCKVYPAISDLSAVTGFARANETHWKVGDGNYTHLFYTVPAGQILILDVIYVACDSADPTRVGLLLQVGVVDYIFYGAPYGGVFEEHIWDKKFILTEGEKLIAQWTALKDGNNIYATMFGSLYTIY